MARASTYKVAPGKSFMLSDGKKRKLLKGGEPIPSGAYDKKALEGFVANGYLIAGSMTEGIKHNHLGVIGADLNPVKETVKVGRLTQTKVSEPPKPAVQTKESPWMFDPASLEGKSLETLTGMIADIDPEWIEEGMDEKTAIEILSQDFKAEEK